MKLPAMIVIAGALFATTAQAQDIPRYDPAAYCREVADFAGGSAQIQRTCMEQEQKAYDALKGRWSSIPASAARYCDEVAGFTGGTYQILEVCIDQEIGAAGGMPEFQF